MSEPGSIGKNAPLHDEKTSRCQTPGLLLTMTTLKVRSDFLRAATGPKVAMPGLLLQTCPTPPDQNLSISAIRVGFTASKKVGNAVARNRAKRRLRALAREILTVKGQAGQDYVLVGRPLTVTRDYALLRADLETAIRKIHAPRPPRRQP